MRRAVILHGTQGSPEGNWFRWLESELHERGFQTWLPQLPHADKPNLQEWIDFIDNQCPFDIDDTTMLVGHSSGATLALLYSIQHPVGQVIAVAPFIPLSQPYIATSWDANGRLFEGSNIVEAFRDYESDGAERLVLFSDDDPYIPANVPRRICELLRINPILLPGQGHFNLEKSEDFKKLPSLLRFIGDGGMRGPVV